MRLLITITGPSCSGKTTLARALVARGGFAEAVSFTTRPPRAGEIEGKDYYFLTREQHGALREVGGLAESVEFAGNAYGSTSAELERHFAKNEPVVIVVEPGGAQQFRSWCRRNSTRHLALFVTNPMDILLQRWVKRVREDSVTSDVTYANRLHSFMRDELRWVNKFPYDAMYRRFDEVTSEGVVSDILETVSEMRVVRTVQKTA